MDREDIQSGHEKIVKKKSESRVIEVVYLDKVGNTAEHEVTDDPSEEVNQEKSMDISISPIKEVTNCENTTKNKEFLTENDIDGKHLKVEDCKHLDRSQQKQNTESHSNTAKQLVSVEKDDTDATVSSGKTMQRNRQHVHTNQFTGRHRDSERPTVASNDDEELDELTG